jgi:integrase
MLTGNQPRPCLARTPWNKGRLIGQKRPLKPKDVRAIRVRLQLEQRKRDLALFNLAIDSKLRGCDLVRLRINDMCVDGQIRDHATVIQQKTGRPVQFEVTEQTRAAIRDWLANTGPASGQYLFPSRFHGQPHISTRQYARIVHRWIERAGLASSAYGTHSLRRTKIYKKTGNLRAVQLLLGHTKLESTVRYLGIEVDDELAISLAVAGPRPSQGIAAQIKNADIEDVSRLGVKLLARPASGLGQRRLTHRNPDLRVTSIDQRGSTDNGRSRD